jgi:hypothetical protein
MKKDEFGRHTVFWITGRGAGVSIERTQRGMGRRSLRHCLGLSPSSPGPGGRGVLQNTHGFILAASGRFQWGPSKTGLLFVQRPDGAAGTRVNGWPIDESSRALEV